MTSDDTPSRNLLGIDAAWTATNPTGLALLRPEGERPRLLRIARSYDEALVIGEGESPDWLAPLKVGPDALPDVLKSWGPVALAAVDMPLARSPITGRRPADTAVSKAYGGRKAAVHSPSAERPGAVGVQLHKALEQAGLSLLTTSETALATGAAANAPVASATAGDGGKALAAVSSPAPDGRWFFETYPHAAIIEMMQLSRRLPYKVGKRGSFWPYAPAETRWRWAAVQLDVLRAGLDQVIEGVATAVPSAQELLAATEKRRGPILKGVEDALDAVVCAWVAHELQAGRTQAFGDADGAILLPLPRV